MTTLEVLKSMRERIAIGWTQKAMARDANGAPCDAKDPHARFWCVFGAGIASGATQAERLAAYGVLLDGDRNPVDVVNDFPGRTKDQILAWIDRAIGSLEGAH